jgi:hypothetical protein
MSDDEQTYPIHTTAHAELYEHEEPSNVHKTDDTKRVAISCSTCNCDVGVWSPPDLTSGYTHIRPGGGPHWDLNGDHEVSPTDYVPFPPSWAGEQHG